MENQLAHAITQTEYDLSYDKAAKKLLANKQITNDAIRCWKLKQNSEDCLFFCKNFCSLLDNRI